MTSMQTWPSNSQDADSIPIWSQRHTVISHYGSDVFIVKGRSCQPC